MSRGGRSERRGAPAVGVFDVLDRPVEDTPDATALVTRSGRLSYAELDRLAWRWAGALRDMGVRAGERVGASLPNDVHVVAAFHAAMRLGAVWVGINQALAPPEKAYMLADSEARLLLTDDAGAEALESSGVLGAGRPGCAVVRPAQWESAVEASEPTADWPRPDPLAPAAIAYTSGTTGFPKGALHCQAGLVVPGAATVARRGWGPSLVKGDSLPLTILNMHVLTTLLTAQAGGTCVVFDRSDVASIVRWIRQERVTVWNGPPAQLWTMVRDPSIDRRDLASLSEVWAGGADCPDRLRRDFEDRFGVPVCRTYGLTEAPALVSLDDLGGAAPDGTSGRPLDHVMVEIVDDEITLRPQDTGEWTGRFRPALGYWRQAAAPGGSTDGRVLRTGDLGVLEGGHLRVLGRRSTMIIRGGANVYPAEIERVLASAPGVAASAVVGVADERLGERVAAAIERRPGEAVDLASVAEHCRANLAAYKVPERWVVVDGLPRNQMGKVPAAAVRALLDAAANQG